MPEIKQPTEGEIMEAGRDMNKRVQDIIQEFNKKYGMEVFNIIVI